MNTTPWPLDGEVHLYGLALPHDPAELARLGGLLTTGEIDRAALLKSEPAKRRCLAGRGLLREILGAYLGLDAKQVQLATGEHGKPFLLGATVNLDFNLAHSGENLLLAIAVNRAVGIDLELIDPGKPLREMARLVFSRREQEQLSPLASPRLEAVFYRNWVRKEACLKACGRGFSLPGNSFELSPLDEKPTVMIACCNQQSWQVLDLAVPRGYCAALAVESRCSTQSPPTVVRVEHPLSFNWSRL